MAAKEIVFSFGQVASATLDDIVGNFKPFCMLTVVGHPTAVNPDWRLRNVARAYQWPVIRTQEG